MECVTPSRNVKSKANTTTVAPSIAHTTHPLNVTPSKMLSPVPCVAPLDIYTSTPNTTPTETPTPTPLFHLHANANQPALPTVNNTPSMLFTPTSFLAAVTMPNPNTTVAPTTSPTEMPSTIEKEESRRSPTLSIQSTSTVHQSTCSN